MAYKILGQVAPAAATPTDLYTVPLATQSVISTIVACNRGTAAKIRISIRGAGAAQADRQYIVYDSDLAGKDSVFFTIGVTLGATDVVTVYSDTAAVSFSAFGSETT